MKTASTMQTLPQPMERLFPIMGKLFQASERIYSIRYISAQITKAVHEKEAVFQLYDTKAAEKLYEQLPLVLDTENFRNAQWMFYPPESLPVTADEAYHDGIKGELSYYEPWGDVVMFYKEFGSYNGLYELGQVISGGEYIESIPEGTYIFEK